MTTNQTFGIFTTDAFRHGEVYDETFHGHARRLMQTLRAQLVASGRAASEVEDHSHYGVAFTVHDPVSARVRLLLQAVDPWLLTLERELGLLDRLRRLNREEVDVELRRVVEVGLNAAGVTRVRWLTREEYDAAARDPGPVDPDVAPRSGARLS